ncbi:MAG: hypothetical protein V9G13_14650 [Marmoricola sp.]
MDGNVLKRSEVATALRNTQKHSHEVVAPQKTFDERKVANFRKFCTDFFDEGNAPKDPLELARHGADKLKGKLDELKATVSGSQVPVRRAAQRPHRPAGAGRRQARRLVPQRLQPRRRPARSQGEPDRPDPVVPQRSAAVDLRRGVSAPVDPQQQPQLPAARQRRDRQGRARRPQRLPRQQDGPAQAGRRRPAQPDRRHRRRRTARRSRRPSRGARPSCSASDLLRQGNARGAAARRRSASTRRSRASPAESQVALILQIGSNFESSDYPALLDLLAASQQGGGDDATAAQKQTVSVKTIAVPGASGVLETEDDVDKYLAALRSALIQTLNDGKRISL